MKLFAQSVAKELALHGIRVGSIASGAIATPINEPVLDDRRSVARSRRRYRWAAGARSPTSPNSSPGWPPSSTVIVGATLFVDGGMTLYPKFV